MNTEDEKIELTRPEKDLVDLEYYYQECMRDFTIDNFEIDELVRAGDIHVEL